MGRSGEGITDGFVPEGPSKAYLAGKRRTTAEVQRSISHAPEDSKTKKPTCWDAACHVGCSRANCPHVHERLPPLCNKLDYTGVTQVLQRGGLKNGPKVNPKDVDGRIAQLRAQQRPRLKSAKGRMVSARRLLRPCHFWHSGFRALEEQRSPHRVANLIVAFHVCRTFRSSYPNL